MPAGIRTRVVRKAFSGIYDWLKHGEPRKIHWAEQTRRGRSGGMSPHASASTREMADYDPDLNGEVEAIKMRKLARALDQLERRGRALSMVDIVLNHTAADSAWLGRHPEAGYSLTNSPALRAAATLDTDLMRFSHEVAQGQYQGDGASPKLCNADAVNKVVDVARDVVPKRLRLWEYYVADTTTEQRAFLAWVGAGTSHDRFGPRGGRPSPDVAGAGSLVFSMHAVPFEAREDAVICDPLYGRGSIQRGARALDRVLSRAEGFSEWDFGPGLPDGEVDELVESLYGSGAVWNDGSGGRFPVHVAPDELVAEV